MKNNHELNKIELESKIQILEQENEVLSAKAEENLLLNKAFEEIGANEETDNLFQDTLESISILLNIEFAGIFEYSEGKFTCYRSYILSQNENNTNIDLTLSEDIQNKIDLKATTYLTDKDAILDFKELQHPIKYCCALIIPFGTEIHKNRYFVSANETNCPNLKERVQLIEKVIHIVSSRLERLYFQKELIRVNNELQNKNKKLQVQNEIIDNKNSSLHSTMEHLKETQANLVQSEKMASLGVLTAGVAHEINNPLNFIAGGVQGMINFFEEIKEDENPRIVKLLEIMNTGINRIANIVTSLNQFSRDIDNFNETCDLHSIIDNCLVMLNNQIKHKIKVIKNYSSDTCSTLGNIGKLHQVIINILSNAIQAIPNKGVIKIKTIESSSSIFVEISDTGCGINPDDLSKITDPFYTTKDPGKGTGLGLSISFNIIKDHEGDLSFKSELNKGTTVTVGLPIK